ncbi:MAG: acetolactate synthase large subunit [Proteobacteria bacterium]|nr:acetolactate synthase large subunit [Pseudomonadota bacterium]
MSQLADGAHVMLEAFRRRGVGACFANPGTSELALVHALDDFPSIRPVLGLFEGVCTGAADGYFRASGKPAMTLLHLGPGLAHGLANLHNARRARSGVLNVVGEHATWHLASDPPLASDIGGLAAPMSDRVVRITSPGQVQACSEEALDVAEGRSPGIATLIAPSDAMSLSAPQAGAPRAAARAVPATSDTAALVRRLRGSVSPVLLLGGAALTDDGLRAAQAVAQATGGRLLMESYPARVELGGDLPRVERLAYFPQDILAQLGASDVLLAGARAPLSYFGYEGLPGELLAADKAIALGDEDVVGALRRLAAELPPGTGTLRAAAEPPGAVDPAALTGVTVAEVVVARLPAGSFVSAEGSTLTVPYLQRAHRAARHAAFTNTGGAIGQGLPVAIGAAIACPDARVVCLQSDGSAQYTVQSLWTMARERLDITILLAANHRYGILQHELARAGSAPTRGQASEQLTTMQEPRMDWVAIGTGYGVPSSRVSNRAELDAALAAALAERGPRLLVLEMP